MRAWRACVVERLEGRALLSAGELLFCGHHARGHEKRLVEIGAALSFVDDR